jgi:hypothetical protein
MRRANIISKTLVYRQGAIDLGDELAQIAGFRINGHTMEGLCNGIQLVIAGYSAPGEWFPTTPVHGVT